MTVTADLGVGVDAGAALVVQVGRLADAVDRDRRAREERRARNLRFAPIQPQMAINAAGIGALLLANSELWGPKTGYFWAVQAIRVTGLSVADSVLAYRGPSGAQAVTLNNQVSPPLTFTAPIYNPGHKGLILQPGDWLTISGAGLTSTAVSASFDVVIGELELLHAFLV
jgi:hypothetical protein